MRAIVLISIPVAIITTVLVFWFSNRSFVGEAAIALAIIAAGLFFFLTIGLYRGVRLDAPVMENPEPLAEGGLDPALAIIPLDVVPKIEPSLPDVGDTGNDLVGCLLSILVWLAISVLLMVLFWVLVQVLAFVLPWVLLALYWLFYRALRIVFAKADVCCGQLMQSAGYGLLYTGLYTGWLFLLLGILELIRMAARV